MIRIFILSLLLLCASIGRAELNIEITQGVDNPTPIAVVPFGWRGFGKPEMDITRIISADLRRVGVFDPIKREDMLALPQTAKNVFYRDWRAVGAEYIVVGRMSKLLGSEIQVDYELIDVYRQKKLFQQRAKGTEDSLRDMAHAIADQVYEKITGIPGAFSTRIAYVSSNAKGNGKFDYRLMLADADGYRPKVLLQSPEPILSPAWSPDGKSLAYVSFEGKKPAIYSHELATRKRVKLTDFSGINGAPAWSPDGRRLAVVLSKDGNPDIFILEVETRKLQKVVSHFAIDTEPSWMADGSGIIFTSDRGGLPQIYHLDISSRRVKRLTFEGDYNARARVLPDGSGFVMIHRQSGNFHVALQKFESGRIWILSQTRMDESPTVAPNGSMLMYATQNQGKGILAAVSVDGGVKYRLPSVSSDVREPAWSPF